MCPSVVADKGIVYSIGGRKNTAIAVRAGGRGDVTKTHLLWKSSYGSNVSSPIFHKGPVYWFHEGRGVAYCLDAATGKLVYRERLTPRPGLTYASTIVADGKLYCVSQYNGAYVLAAEPKFRPLAHNVLEDDKSRVNGCMAVSDGHLFLRTDSAIYCIGKK